jgi:predicted transglutaminase-like cysteine proteinase
MALIIFTFLFGTALSFRFNVLVLVPTVLTITTGSINSAHAVPIARDLFAYTTAVDSAATPRGWTDFCRRYSSECENQPSARRKLELSSEARDRLVVVNEWVNGHVKRLTDRQHWRVEERWDYAEDGYGDCEDYALLKRRKLIALGFPREALLMTIVRDLQHAGHAVLIVHTDQGDLVLDNQISTILPWWKTGYNFVMRQSQSDPNVWLLIDSGPRSFLKVPLRRKEPYEALESPP